MIRILISLLLLSVAAQARLSVAFDHALFRSEGRTDTARLEAYYLIDRGSLDYQQLATGYEAAYRAYLEIRTADSVWHTDAWERFDRVNHQSEILTGQKIPDQAEIRLPTGQWQVLVYVQDQASGEVRKMEWPVHITREGLEECLSDPILLSRPSVPTAEVQLFNRNGLLVVPYADGIYGAELTDLYFFAEYYPDNEVEHFPVQATVLSADRLGLIKPLSITPETLSTGMFIRAAIPVDQLPSGSYYLEITPETGTPRQKKFFIYNPGVESLPTEMVSRLQSQEFADMDSLELIDYFGPLKYVADGVEIEQFQNLDSESRRHFLMAFWQRRNSAGNQRSNPYKEMFMKRLDYVNRNFKSQLQEGWETDRGRIWLKYGEPTSIDRNEFPAGNNLQGKSGNAYQDPDDYTGRSDYSLNSSSGMVGDVEIWEYHQLEGGVIFVFVDRNWLGDFYLVHSTKTGEIQNYDWQQILQ